MRAVIFANGVLDTPELVPDLLQPDDLLVAADGGLRHCQALGLTPQVLIGDFDSLSPEEVTEMERQGVQVLRHPAQKDYTDLELALQFAQSTGVDQILVLAALGNRWDQTLTNLLLPAGVSYKDTSIVLVAGRQEIRLLNADRSTQGDSPTLIPSPARLDLQGQPGDTLSLIPVAGDAIGVTTSGLQYPLHDEILFFGATRGVSNLFLDSTIRVELKLGMLLCVHIRGDEG